MMKRLGGVSIALIALLTVASACFAADPPAANLSAAALPEAKFEPGGPGTSAIGGDLGLSYFIADADYVNSRDPNGQGRDMWKDRDAGMRFAFSAKFRYTWSRHWRWQVSPGFLWTGYKDTAPAPFRTENFPDDSLKGSWLTLVMPVSAQIQWMQRSKTWIYHEGLGPGVYRVWVEQNRKVVKDPQSRKLHSGFYPGATAEFGVERYLKSLSAVSLELTLATHFVFAQRDEQFPLGFNSNVWTSELRFGANYSFNPRAAKKSGTKPAEKKS
jgi:hypothetical protein